MASLKRERRPDGSIYKEFCEDVELVSNTTYNTFTPKTLDVEFGAEPSKYGSLLFSVILNLASHE